MDLGESSWRYIDLLPDIIVFACQECKPNKFLEFPADAECYEPATEAQYLLLTLSPLLRIAENGQSHCQLPLRFFVLTDWG